MSKFKPTTYGNSRSLKDKYLYTKGFKYSLNGENYIGEYHLNGDDAFTGPIPTNESKILRKYYTNADLYEYDRARGFPKRVRIPPNQIVFKATETDYENGYTFRYFIERAGLLQSYPLEIDEQQAGSFGSENGIDEGLYTLVKIKWLLVGYERSRSINGRLVEGVYEHNVREVQKARGIISNLDEALKSYTEGARFLFFNQ